MKNVIHAYGVLASPLQLSATLTNLNVSHVVVDSSLQARPTLKDVAKRQPAWPIVLPSVQALRRFRLPYERQVLYVCGSLAELQETNLRVIRDWRLHLTASLRHAVVSPFNSQWVPIIREQPIEDYVKTATKESFLNLVQTAIYELTPYDLKKTVQLMVVSYLAGELKWRPLQQKLNSSYKLERLKALMSDPQCAVLKAAIVEYRKSSLEEIVAKQFGVEPFDILYVVNSAAKAKAKQSI